MLLPTTPANQPLSKMGVGIDLPNELDHTTPVYSIRRDGEIWKVTCDGKTIEFVQREGLKWFAVLAKHPDQVLYVQMTGPDIYELTLKNNSSSGSPSYQPTHDLVSKKEIRARLDALRAQLDVSDAPDKNAELSEEIEKLVTDLRSARSMPTGDPLKSKARSIVKSIKTDLAKTAKKEGFDSFVKHLKAVRQDGAAVIYEPSPTVNWRVHTT